MAVGLYLAALLLLAQVSACPTNSVLPGIEVGHAYFSTSDKQKQLTTTTYQHNYQTPFAIVPAVALSVHSLGIQTVLTEWALTVQNVNFAKLTIRFRLRPSEWTMIKAGFWVCSRSDIYLGSVSSSFDNMKQAIRFINVSIRPSMPNLNTSIMRAFITGFTMKSGNQIFIRVFDKTINQNKIQIGVQVGGSMQISFIHVNFIIFSPQTSSFASYGGGVNEIGLTQGKMVNIQKNIHSSQYIFHGVANMRQSMQTPLMLLTEVDTNFYLKMDTLAQIAQFFISYIVIGVSPGQVCSACKDTIISNNQCVSQCPISSFMVGYKDGGKGCRVCPAEYNMVVNQGRNGCVCRSGYVEKKGYCVDNGNVDGFATFTSLSFQSSQQPPPFKLPATSQSSISPTTNGQTRSISSSQSIINRIVPISYPSIPIPITRTIQSTNTNSASTASTINTNQLNSPTTSPTTSSTTSPTTSSTTSTSIRRVADLSVSSSRLVPENNNQIIPPVQQITRLPTSFNYGSNLGNQPVQSATTGGESNINSIINGMRNLNSGVNKIVHMDLPTMSAIPIVNAIPVVTNPIISNTNNGKDTNINVDQYYTPTIPEPIPVTPAPLSYANTNMNTNSNILPDHYPKNPATPSYPAPAPPAYQPQSQPSNPAPPSPSPPQASFSLVQILSSPPASYQPKDCSGQANTYWTGYRCACKVGFSPVNSICVPIPKPLSNATRPSEFIYRLSGLVNRRPSTCEGDNEMHDGQTCVCVEGCYRGTQGKCIRRQANQPDKNDPYYPPTNCPPNSRLVGRQCECREGLTMVNYQCVRRRVQCGQNSSSNEQNQCICNPGYIIEGNRCVVRSLCGPYSAPDRTGKCQCQPGYRLYGSQCQQCPSGQVMVYGKCEMTCGVNQAVINGKCACMEGYGLYTGVCRICPDDYFLFNGYCATCPGGSYYDARLRNCTCDSMFNNVGGSCIRKCEENEEYSIDRSSCTCLPGMTRANGKCQPCLGMINPNTLQCQLHSNCKENEVRSGSQCICRPGFGFATGRICTRCESIPHSFLLEGYCVICPANTQLISGRCACPPGKRLEQGRCIETCRANQLADSNGYCYYCPINEEIVNGRCVCRNGLERVNGVCQLRCTGSNVEINGVCASCAFNMEYDRLRKVCICPRGQYATTNGVCQTYIPPPISCGQGLFFSQTTRKCEPCPQGCKFCESSNICTQCSLEGFYLSVGTCVSRCGDGIKTQNQGCDDGNSVSNDGCSSSCTVEPNCNCQGFKPSRCTMPQPVCGDGIATGNEQCDDRNYNRGDGCFNCVVQIGWRCDLNQCVRISSIPPTPNPVPTSPTPPSPPSTPVGTGTNLKQVGETIINQNNVFASLETPFSFKFASTTQMRAFMKYQFPSQGTEPTSAYCVQRPSNPKIYQCLIIYASGVPNRIFSINFSYNYQGESGNLSVPVNPFNSILRTRSLK